MSAEYDYDNDRLTKVQTPTTAYTFTYGDFGLRSSIKAGSYTLASYSYTDDRNHYLAPPPTVMPMHQMREGEEDSSITPTSKN